MATHLEIGGNKGVIHTIRNKAFVGGGDAMGGDSGFGGRWTIGALYPTLKPINATFNGEQTQPELTCKPRHPHSN